MKLPLPVTARSLAAYAVLAPTLLFGLPGAALADDEGAPTENSFGDVTVINTETVQAHTDATGEVQEQRVYEQISLTGDGDVTVVNPVETDGLRNLDGFGGFEVEGDDQVYTTTVDGVERLRSVSPYEDDLPITVDITYLLDGEEVEPGDVVGESGRLEVKYHVENNTGQDQEIEVPDGSGGTVTRVADVVVPMVGSLTTTTPSNFTDVESDQANMAGDGRGGTKLSFTMTLFPPIGSSSSDFGYTATIVDGVIPDASISALPVDPLDVPSLRTAADSYEGGSETGERLTAGASEIDANLLRLRDGAQELSAGLIQLYDGADRLSAGLNDVAAPGADRLAAGAGELTAGAGELADGAEELSAGAGELADGTGRLDDGAERLYDGVNRLDAGATQVDDGAQLAAVGARRVADGAGELSAGAGLVAGGAEAIADGAGQVNDGAGQLATGADNLADGADQLDDGAGQVADGADTLSTGAGRLDDGAGRLAAGLNRAVDSAPALLDGLRQVRQGLNRVDEGLALLGTRVTAGGTELQTGVDRLKAGISNRLVPGLQQLRGGIETQVIPGVQRIGGASACAATILRHVVNGGAATTLANCPDSAGNPVQLPPLPPLAGDELSVGRAQVLLGSARFSDGASGGATTLVGAINTQILPGFDSLICGLSNPTGLDCNGDGTADTGLLQGVDALGAGINQLVGGVNAAVGDTDDVPDDGTLRGGVHGLQAGTGQLVVGGEELLAGLGLLSDGADELAAGTDRLATGAGELAEGADRVADGAGAVAVGSDRLATGADTLFDGTGALVAGSNRVADGAGEVAGGSGALAAGADELADGAGRLAAGTGELSAGATTLAIGAGDLSAGATRVDDGAGRLSDGSVRLSDGAGRLSDGSGRLSDGAGQLADGLGDAADGSRLLRDGLDRASGGAPELATGASRLSKEGTRLLIEAGEETTLNFGEKYALMVAGGERAQDESMAFGAPEGAEGITAYTFEIHGENGAETRNWARGVAALAVFGAGAGLMLLRRRMIA